VVPPPPLSVDQKVAVSSALGCRKPTTNLQPKPMLNQKQLFLQKVMEDEVAGQAFLLLLI
jgi:hypothetical protein